MDSTNLDSELFIEFKSRGKRCQLFYISDSHSEGLYEIVSTERERLAMWLPWVDEMKSVENQGFVKQGLKELIKIIPSKFKIDKLLIYIDVDNVKSKFIPISLGFKKESKISQFEFYNGSYHDFEIYGLNVNEGNIAND